MLQASSKSATYALALPTRRGLSRVEAAEYIGVGASKFDAMVSDGRMPKPKKIEGGASGTFGPWTVHLMLYQVVTTRTTILGMSR